jgi:hypothetical protein
MNEKETPTMSQICHKETILVVNPTNNSPIPGCSLIKSITYNWHTFCNVLVGILEQILTIELPSEQGPEKHHQMGKNYDSCRHCFQYIQTTFNTASGCKG